MMRSWLSWKGSDAGRDSNSSQHNQQQQPQQDGKSKNEQPPPQAQEESGGRLTRGSRGGFGQPPPPPQPLERSGNVIQTLMANRSSAAADAEMERRVSIAARNLATVCHASCWPPEWGETGRRTWASGRSGCSISWGAATATARASPRERETPSRTLTSCSLTPHANDSCSDAWRTNSLNLIHCLRLLRVLELQHDHAVAKSLALHSHSENNDDDTAVAQIAPLRPGPVSTRATKKGVSSLISALLGFQRGGTIASASLWPVGTVGASYPLSGVRIANAASEVSFGIFE
eukprot:CCRYP_000744-RC/>CCRYP_000744-RC protein AED:0.01 eAED:0.01 QI:306/1/1/1/0.66/0.5/4/11376/288